MATLLQPNKLIETWLEHLTADGRHPLTLQAYRRGWDHLTRWYQTTYGELCDPTRLIARDIRDWKSYQQSIEKTAPSTINQRLVAVSSFYKWAIAHSQIARDPTADVNTIRLAPRQPKSLSTKQLRRLLRAVHNGGSSRDVAIIELLVGAGLRVGELLHLQVGDIVLHDRSGRVIVREGKHGGYREVPLTKEVRQALIDYLETHPAYTAGREGHEEVMTPLWWGKQGALTHRSSVLRLLQKYAIRAQLDSLSPHVLRHTFATHYLKANPDDLRGLAALLGHSDLNTVMVYTEPTQEDLVNRMERMSNIQID
jgi:site-specific recombinase XerD